MARRRYAKQTTVSVAKSKGEIDDLLRKWGATQLQWTDDTKGGKAMLRFIWDHEGVPFMARFVITMPTEEDIEAEALDGRNGEFSQRKFDDMMKRRGMVEHRELALLIKACFVAVEAGIITAEQIFLPFLEDGTGFTVAEMLIPQLKKIGAQADFNLGRLLTAGKK